MQCDPGGGPRGQLPRARRHLEQSRLAQLDQPLPPQFESGRHPRPMRLDANCPRRDSHGTRDLDPRPNHV